ncbi:Rieske (2Fe-2S) protein [Nocardioides aurantiacus]|uniref:Cytochrome bc1 complex Rieske iron-sulfur subunit n=1 Tax=Nocardioides aurantiacus TaxID=86796 RepID=A0A3N2CT59_9ACTN|nr:Rieske (2Fe-2S) protein [Nocardioides aurantiacus]ROR90616.1 nitrite reductase/ring-hydroxylating ferredoxin subunit [Nocardioides aurantiacus]
MTPQTPTDARSSDEAAAVPAHCPRSASRRALVGGVLGVGVGVPLVAACGSGSSGSDQASDEASGDGGGSTTSSGPITTTSKVPVGGGLIFAGEKVVVTQPTEGEFKAFTAVCTHAQCVVTSVEDDEIDCSCHGSRFSITDGSVVTGPADRPLAELQVSVEGEDISVS